MMMNTLKKEVYYLWHKANEIYQVDPVSTKKKLDKKTKKRAEESTLLIN